MFIYMFQVMLYGVICGIHGVEALKRKGNVNNNLALTENSKNFLMDLAEDYTTVIDKIYSSSLEDIAEAVDEQIEEEYKCKWNKC